MPRSIIKCAAAMGAIVMFAPAESVTLKARTIPLSDSARRISGPRSVPFGGFSSVVTTNSPELSASENVSNGASLIGRQNDPLRLDCRNYSRAGCQLKACYNRTHNHNPDISGRTREREHHRRGEDCGRRTRRGG